MGSKPEKRFVLCRGTPRVQTVGGNPENVQTPHQDHLRGVRREKCMEYAKTNKRSGLKDEPMLKKLTVFFRSEPQLKEILPADIEGFKLFRKKQVTGSTVNRELALLRRMFNRARPLSGVESREESEVLWEERTSSFSITMKPGNHSRYWSCSRVPNGRNRRNYVAQAASPSLLVS